MKMTIVIVLTSFLFLGCGNAFSSAETEDSSSSMTLLKLSDSVRKATVNNIADIFFVRIEGGLLPLPNTFVLHTLQSRGKLFSAELNNDENDVKEGIFFSSIWMWNRGEKESQLHDEAHVIEDHKISDLLNVKCNRKVIVSRNEQHAPGTNTVASMIFIDIGDQVIAVDSELEKLLTAAFESYARINC